MNEPLGGGAFLPVPLRIEAVSSSFLAPEIRLSNPVLRVPATDPWGEGGLGGGGELAPAAEAVSLSCVL